MSLLQGSHPVPRVGRSRRPPTSSHSWPTGERAQFIEAAPPSIVARVIQRLLQAGMLEAEKQFRNVIGYTQLPQLAVAIERRLHLH